MESLADEDFSGSSEESSAKAGKKDRPDKREKLRIYQIGLSGIGRLGFERLIRLSDELSSLDIEIKGVFDMDYDRLERAKRFGEVNGMDIELFQEIDEMYRRAEAEDGRVMIYDAGTVESRPENIYRSMERSFFHLAEKPPSMTREQHLKEREMAKGGKALWKVDFLERESPIVRKTCQMIEDSRIDSIEIFRQDSSGVEQLLNPEARQSVKGGDILDNMIRDVYVMDFLNASKNGESNLNLEDASSEYLMPYTNDSRSLKSLKGSKTSNPEDACSAKTKAKFNSSDIDIKISSSFMGMDRNCMSKAREIKEKTGFELFERKFSQIEEGVYHQEEARFFTVTGERNLAGDLLHGKLFDLDTGDEIETASGVHDRLYKVLEKAIFTAVGDNKDEQARKLADRYIETLYDVRDEAIDGSSVEETSKASEKISSKIIEGEVSELNKRGEPAQ